MDQERCVSQIALAVFLFFVIFGLDSLLIEEKSIYNPLMGADPNIMGFSQPSAKHVLGTDYAGRDIASQLLTGSYKALVSGFRTGFHVAVPVFLFVFFRAWRGYEPYLEHPPAYLFIFLPFCAFQMRFALALPIASITGGSVISSLFYLILFLPFLWLVTWKSYGHLVVYLVQKRREKVSFLRLYLETVPIFFFILLFIMSWGNIVENQLSFFGMGDPNTVSWGLMLQGCFTTGYTFRAPFWLITPGLCIWLFSFTTSFLAWRGYENLRKGLMENNNQ